MKIHEAAENYLETILILKKRIENLRAIDIVNELNYSKPTVSIALRNLINQGYIVKDGNGYLNFTASGRQIAEKVYERHLVLTALLINLGVRPHIAAADACKIEHIISEESFLKLKHLYEQRL